MTFPNERDCEHGNLRRTCPICEQDEEIARLRAELASKTRDADHFFQLSGKYLEELNELSKKLDALQLAKMIGHKNPRQLMVYYRESAADIAKKL